MVRILVAAVLYIVLLSTNAFAWPSGDMMFLAGDTEATTYGIVSPQLTPPSGDGVVQAGIGGGAGIEYFPKNSYAVRGQFTYIGYPTSGGQGFNLMALTGGGFWKAFNFEKSSTSGEGDARNFLYLAADGGISLGTTSSYVIDLGVGINVDQFFVEWKAMWAPSAVPVPGGTTGFWDYPITIGFVW